MDQNNNRVVHGDGNNSSDKIRIDDLHNYLKLTIPIIFSGFALIVTVALGILAFTINSKVESDRENIKDTFNSLNKVIDERLKKVEEDPKIELYSDKSMALLAKALLVPDYKIDKNNNKLFLTIYPIVKNIGNSPTKYIIIKLYTNYPLSLSSASTDELEYQNEGVYYFVSLAPPAYSAALPLDFELKDDVVLSKDKEKIKLKVYYGVKLPYEVECYVAIDKDKIKQWEEKLKKSKKDQDKK